MRKTKKHMIYWGVVLILAAILLVLEGLGFSLSGGALSPWRIGLAVLVFGWLAVELIKVRFIRCFFPIAFLFLLSEPLLAQLAGRTDGNLIANWIVLVAAGMLTIGAALLFPRSKSKKGIISNIASSNLTRYFDGGELDSATIKDIAGNATVYITNPQNYKGNGTIIVRDIAGRVEIHVPKDWLVTTTFSDIVGRVIVPPKEERVYTATIHLDVKDVAGCVEVVLD